MKDTGKQNPPTGKSVEVALLRVYWMDMEYLYIVGETYYDHRLLI